MKKLIIFASGQGTNAEAIINYFKEGGQAEVVLIVTNRANAGVVSLAVREHIPFLLTNKKRLSEAMMIEELEDYQPALIILAGFLLKIPPSIIEAFPGKIINIHPALLPAYGGDGMWGANVHRAVLENNDAQSGISIHRVDDEYDHGEILLQARCPVEPNDDAESLAARIHKLEHFYYPRVIGFMLEEVGEN